MKKKNAATGASAQHATPDAIAKLSAKEFQRTVLRRWSHLVSIVVGWGLFICAWYALSTLIGSQKLPSPHVIFSEVWTIIIGPGGDTPNASAEANFVSSIQVSLTRVVTGFLLAFIISIGLASLVAYRTWWRDVVTRLLELITNIPTVSLALIALLTLGVSSLGPTLTTTLVATPYILMNLLEGLTNVDHGLIIMSRSFGRTRMQIITSVLIPSSFYSMLGGARTAFTAAWHMEILTEVFASSAGVGFQIRSSFVAHDLRGLLAWTVLFILIMLIFDNLIFRQIENRAYIGIKTTME